jgi:hypothetical protein
MCATLISQEADFAQLIAVVDKADGDRPAGERAGK